MPFFIWIFSNGQVWFSKEPGVPGGAKAFTLVSCYRINGAAHAQVITTLTGSGNASASALAATGGTGATIAGSTGRPNSASPTTITELT